MNLRGAGSVIFLCALTSGCAASGHAVRPAELGTVSRTSALEAVIDLPGPVTLETIVSADWVVSLAGLVNLSHPKAEAAKLQDRDEPIQIYMHAFHHPTRGMYLVDSGVADKLKDHPADVGVGWLVARELHLEKLTTRTSTQAWLQAQRVPLAGVMVTHLHVDHVSGMPDVPRGTALFAGPGETTARELQNLVLAGSMDGLLEGHGPVSQWQFVADPDGQFEGVLDIFGDGSVWALWVPGHTPGSTAYLVRTPQGPVLLVGDTCHTRWGWDNGVEPGKFSHDKPASAISLQRLRAFVAKQPKITVRLGHQP